MPLPAQNPCRPPAKPGQIRQVLPRRAAYPAARCNASGARDEDDRVDRRDELGKHRHLLQPAEPGGTPALRRAEFGRDSAAIRRFPPHRGHADARRLGRGGGRAGGDRPCARTRRRGDGADLHQHHAQAGQFGGAGGVDPAAAHRRYHLGGGAGAGAAAAAAAGHTLHHGAGFLPRPHAPPARPGAAGAGVRRGSPPRPQRDLR